MKRHFVLLMTLTVLLLAQTHATVIDVTGSPSKRDMTVVITRSVA